MLARDGHRGPEIFLVRRHAKSAFGDAYVFPGGIVDQTDKEVRSFCTGLKSSEANRLLGVDDGGVDYYIAAIRELFEETGVLLAEHSLAADQLEVMRERMNANTLEWKRFVEEADAQMRCAELHYFSHWITPDALPKRYTTRFFVARIPADQNASHVDGELTDACWMTAADALAAGERGDMRLYFPTIKTLQRLAEHKRVDALVDWADKCAREGVVAIHPVLPKDARPGGPHIPDVAEPAS